MTIDKYLNKLAARSPAPGGGSAAALVGAIGISLLSMVAKYIIGRKGRKVSDKRLTKILEFAEYTRHRLRKLMSKDEAVYLRLSRELQNRTVKNNTKLYKRSAEVPLEVCEILQEGMKRCEELYPYCKRTLISDLVEAALLLEASFLSAKLNVEINLKGVNDPIYIKKINSSLSRRAMAISKIKKRILSKYSDM